VLGDTVDLGGELMAINITCWKCQKEFMTSASNYGALCDDCNGVNEAKRKDEERWRTLTVEQKLDELRKMIEAIQQHQVRLG
jgi:hypothetical protein